MSCFCVCAEKEGAANHIMELSKTISQLQERLSSTKEAGDEAFNNAKAEFSMRLEVLSKQQDVSARLLFCRRCLSCSSLSCFLSFRYTTTASEAELVFRTQKLHSAGKAARSHASFPGPAQKFFGNVCAAVLLHSWPDWCCRNECCVTGGQISVRVSCEYQ